MLQAGVRHRDLLPCPSGIRRSDVGGRMSFVRHCPYSRHTARQDRFAAATQILGEVGSHHRSSRQVTARLRWLLDMYED